MNIRNKSNSEFAKKHDRIMLLYIRIKTDSIFNMFIYIRIWAIKILSLSKFFFAHKHTLSHIDPASNFSSRYYQLITSYTLKSFAFRLHSLCCRLHAKCHFENGSSSNLQCANKSRNCIYFFFYVCTHVLAQTELYAGKNAIVGARGSILITATPIWLNFNANWITVISMQF